MDTKIIRMGLKFTCTATEHLTKYNRQRNKEVFETCYQQPKFRIKPSCDGCTYLEKEEQHGRIK